MKHGDIVISRADKAMSRLMTSIRKDVHQTVTDYFEPVRVVVRSAAAAMGGGGKPAKAAAKQGRKQSRKSC